MKTFLVLVFCLLLENNGVSAFDVGGSLAGIGIDIDLGGDTTAPMPRRKGWTTIMQRFDGSVSFDRTWNEYRVGFGDLEKEFWLGNEVIYQMTRGGTYKLTIEVNTDKAWYNADYSSFSIDSEDNKYAIHVSGFSGLAGDSLTNASEGSHWYHDGMGFSTPDVENDKSIKNNCAQKYSAGWWFNDCWYSCLTCVFGSDNFGWDSLKHLPSKGVLKAARMRIRRI